MRGRTAEPGLDRRVRREHQLPKGEYLEAEDVEGRLWVLLHAEPLRKGGRRAPAGRRRPAFEPPAPPPRPFFRSEYGLYFVPRAMLSALLALLLFVARLPARAAARLSSRRGY
mgnify:CR=1 FL=1